MSDKAVVMIAMSIGSLVGSYAPMLFGVSMLSMTSLVGGAIGGIIGIYVGYKLVNQ